MVEYGLIGKTLKHSFSKSYFEKKFQQLGLKDHVYSNFELDHIDKIKTVFNDHPNIKGFNVTIPYKESVIPFLDELSDEAKAIGAVNCVKIENGKLTGYNTDAFGFASSVKPFLEPHHNKALILGTGGASKAIAFALKNIGVEVYYASSSKQNALTFSYDQLNEHMLHAFKLIVNTTPLGMFPNVNECPDIPYQFLTPEHLCYDVIYNPETTLYLNKAKEQDAVTINGLSMLQLQAEKSWEIWNL
jgi:shikimate dehydrogenase